jgi:transposase
LEACATAHYWARELGALGHEVRLMPAQYVKAYIKDRPVRIEKSLDDHRLRADLGHSRQPTCR